MKNTSMKKKALLSSVAMLLVALVALGSATFAWFTQNATANASGVTVKTTKSSSLQIRNVANDWAESITYADGSSAMKPASTVDGTSFVTTFAESSSAFTKATDAEITDITTDTSKVYFYTDVIAVKNAGGEGAADIKNVTIALTDAILPSYARFAYAEVSAENFNPGTLPTTFGTLTICANAETPYYPLTSSGESSDQITPTTNTTISVSDLAQGAAKYYRFWIWFEGQDPECTDGNAGQSFGQWNFVVSGSQA